MITFLKIVILAELVALQIAHDQPLSDAINASPDWFEDRAVRHYVYWWWIRAAAIFGMVIWIGWPQ